MLEGVVRFPPEFAARYRAKGYWEDRSLADTFAEVFAKHANLVALIDRGQFVTYAQLNERSERLALNLLEQGLKPLDRVVMLTDFTLRDPPNFNEGDHPISRKGPTPFQVVPN